MSDNKLVHKCRNTHRPCRWHWLAGEKPETAQEKPLAPRVSANVMNYVKFTAVMAGSIALKQYLEDQKILPDSV